MSPSEVEGVLRLHPAVEDAAVFGMPLERGGEMVVAAVVLEPGATFDEEALRAHCREHLAAYKIPKRIVPITDTPRSMLGKILRKQVREQVCRCSTVTLTLTRALLPPACPILARCIPAGAPSTPRPAGIHRAENVQMLPLRR